MAHGLDQPERFCLGCTQSLRGVISSRCPECGKPFDHDDARTTSAVPRTEFWLALATSHRVLLVLMGAGSLVIIALCAVGYDPLWLFLPAFVTIHILLVMIVLAVIPKLPINWKERLAAPLIVGVIVSVPFTVWPLRVTFALHRPWLEPIAQQARESGTMAERGRTGLFEYRQVRRIEEGSVGFQFTGGAGGGVYLVQRGPNNALIWYNTNWIYSLGHDWYLVYED